MPANLENSALATGLEKSQLSFQSQRTAMPKNAHTTVQLQLYHTQANNAQNDRSDALIVQEPRTSRCPSWI